jgi:hypothetical protein
MMIGVIATLPVAVYNIIMFIQPALVKRLSRARVYATTLASLLLAGAGAAFGFLIIIPLALRFFYKFQVDGLIAIISADEYLRFVVSVIITFVLIFQLPLFISLIDHIKPLPPKKLLKLEKYIIVGSVFIGVVVPFALDPTVQLLIASPIIVLYNLSIVIVMIQQAVRGRRAKKQARQKSAMTLENPIPVPQPVVVPIPVDPPVPTPVVSTAARRPVRSIDGVARRKPSLAATAAQKSLQPATTQVRSRPIMSDIRPAPRLTPPSRSTVLNRRPVVE